MTVYIVSAFHFDIWIMIIYVIKYKFVFPVFPQGQLTMFVDKKQKKNITIMYCICIKCLFVSHYKCNKNGYESKSVNYLITNILHRLKDV